MVHNPEVMTVTPKLCHITLGLRVLDEYYLNIIIIPTHITLCIHPTSPLSLLQLYIKQYQSIILIYPDRLLVVLLVLTLVVLIHYMRHHLVSWDIPDCTSQVDIVETLK